MTHKSNMSKLDKNFVPVEAANDLKWYDIRDLGLEGQGWRDTESPYDRLPARAKSIVRPTVWDLAQHSAGLCVRFMTDCPSISARWKLRNANLAMNHMPASGMSGLDLYAKLKGKWIWAGVGIPNAQTTSLLLGGNYAPGLRQYMLMIELNPAVYILDCLPNMNPDQVRERTEPAVLALRAAHPDTPIVLVENIAYCFVDGVYTSSSRWTLPTSYKSSPRSKRSG